jgi:hypothetical protein
MNLSHYVTAEDYAVFAGPDWPSYPAYIAGVQASRPEIRQEIAEFTQQQLAQGEKFPIKTATACQSKWTWSTIWLNYLASASCHRVKPTEFALEDFDNFHNLPKKISDRQLMLKGEWPQGGCEYCRDIEHAGGWSDRQHNLDIRGLTPVEVLEDSTAVHVSPRIVEIFAQNVCNLSCIYCFPDLSSRIEQENRRHGEFNQGGVKIPVITKPTVAAEQYFEKFKQWLENNVQTLARLHLLGGETFIQHDLMTSVLDILERKPCPELEFCVFSNLNAPESAWNRYIPRIRNLQAAGNIRVFDLTASIDCWGPEQSYVRSGLDLDLFEQRFAWASEQGPWLRLNANQTVTSMTIKTMPGLIQKIDQYSKHKHIGHYFQFYTGNQMFQHPKHFAWQHWEQDFERIFAAMPQRTPEQQEAFPRMMGLQKLLQSKPNYNYNEIRKLHIYLDELDRRRGTNWRELFSYLDVKQ